MTMARRFFLRDAPAVRARLERAGFVSTTRWDFDLYWRPQVPSRAAYASLMPGQRVNHIPGIGALTSPRLLAETLARAGVRHAAASAAPLASRFVLIASVDPLRVYVHASSPGPSSEVSAIVEAKIRRAIVHAVVAAREGMTRAVRDTVRAGVSCFELLRFDFELGTRGLPALVRCALSPTLEASSSLIDDTLALLGITPRGDVDALPDAEAASDLEARWRAEANLELARAGRFERLVPPRLLTSPSVGRVLERMGLPRRSDLVIAAREALCDLAIASDAAGAFVEEALVLFSARTQRFYVPNATAAYVWLRIEDGAGLDAIARELAERFGIALAGARDDVWDIAARWTSDGLVRPVVAAGQAAVDHGRRAPAMEPWSRASDELAHETGAPGAVCARRDRLLPLLRRSVTGMLRRLVPSFAALPGVALRVGAQRGATILVGSEAMGAGALAAILTTRGATPIASGAVVLDPATRAPLPLPLAFEIGELDDAAVAAVMPAFSSAPTFVLPSELAAKYVPFEVRNDATRPVATVVLLRGGRETRDGADRERVRAVDRLTVLRELTELGLNASPPFDARSAADFLAWLSEVRCLVLTIDHDPVAAASALELFLAHEHEEEGTGE